MVVYVLGLVIDWSDAEEIIQETNLVLWRELGRFRPGTNYTTWASRVALNRVLRRRRRRPRDRFEFSDSVAEVASAESDRLEERERALARYIEELPPGRRLLLDLRYRRGIETEAIARELGRRRAPGAQPGPACPAGSREPE